MVDLRRLGKDVGLLTLGYLLREDDSGTVPKNPTPNHVQPNLEETVINIFNEQLLLPRKSFEVTAENGDVLIEEKLPLTCKPEIIEMADAVLAKIVQESYRKKDTKKWDEFWAREYVAAQSAIATHGGTYRDYLPGRDFMYSSLSRAIVSLFGTDINGKNIAELGCGSGIALTKLAESGASVTGLDTSQVALTFAQYLSEHYNVQNNVTLVNGSFYETDFDNNQFDVVYNSGVFEHLKGANTKKLLNEMIRITKPGGYILISIPNEQSPFYKGFKERERTTFERFKDFDWVRLPWEESRYPLNLRKVMENASLSVVAEDGLLIAPSYQIKKGDISRGDIKFFANNFKELIPEPIRTTEGKVNVWGKIELRASPEQRMKYGWSIYAIGQKAA